MSEHEIDLAGLRAAAEAEAATPGGWVHDGGWTITSPPPDGWDGPHVIAEMNRCRNDGAYIAAASPDVVLALIERLEAAEGGLARDQEGPQDATTADLSDSGPECGSVEVRGAAGAGEGGAL